MISRNELEVSEIELAIPEIELRISETELEISEIELQMLLIYSVISVIQLGIECSSGDKFSLNS